MKNLLGATALSVILSLSSGAVLAHGTKAQKDQESELIKASYSLPKDDGDTFRQTLREADEENANLKQQLALGHADLYDLMTAPDFDRKAFIAKAQEVRKAQEQMHENRDEAFAAAAEQLTQEERETFAHAFEANKHAAMTHSHHHKMSSNSKPAASDTSSDDNGDGKTVSQ